MTVETQAADVAALIGAIEALSAATAADVRSHLVRFLRGELSINEFWDAIDAIEELEGNREFTASFNRVKGNTRKSAQALEVLSEEATK